MTAIVDAGRVGAKFSSKDDLLQLMRSFVSEGASREEAIGKCYSAIMRDEILTSDAVRYTCANLYERCIIRQRTQTPAIREANIKLEADTKAKTKETIEAKIKLWTWKVPTVGKPLSECTFGELPETAPIIGRFLTKLAQQGAPGTLIKEVFTSEEDLQSFWRSSQ